MVWRGNYNLIFLSFPYSTLDSYYGWMYERRKIQTRNRISYVIVTLTIVPIKYGIMLCLTAPNISYIGWRQA